MMLRYLIEKEFKQLKRNSFLPPPYPAFSLHDDAGHALGRHTGNREPAHCRHR